MLRKDRAEPLAVRETTQAPRPLRALNPARRSPTAAGATNVETNLDTAGRTACATSGRVVKHAAGLRGLRGLRDEVPEALGASERVAHALVIQPPSAMDRGTVVRLLRGGKRRTARNRKPDAAGSDARP